MEWDSRGGEEWKAIESKQVILVLDYFIGNWRVKHGCWRWKYCRPWLSCFRTSQRDYPVPRGRTDGDYWSHCLWQDGTSCQFFNFFLHHSQKSNSPFVLDGSTWWNDTDKRKNCYVKRTIPSRWEWTYAFDLLRSPVSMVKASIYQGQHPIWLYIRRRTLQCRDWMLRFTTRSRDAWRWRCDWNWGEVNFFLKLMKVNWLVFNQTRRGVNLSGGQKARQVAFEISHSRGTHSSQSCTGTCGLCSHQICPSRWSS